MSNIKICDRCMKKIPTHGGMNIRALMYRHFILETETKYDYGTHDLCNDCMKKFEAFMDGAEIVPIENPL